MTKYEAVKQLNLGYLFLLVGFLFGIFAPQEINEGNPYGIFMWGYLFWSYYWGYKIIKTNFKNSSHLPVTIKTDNIYSYFLISMQLMFYFLIFKFLFSLIIGIVGGAIFKQIQLSKIAYFKN